MFGLVAIDMTLDKWLPTWFGVAKMTLMVPKGGFEIASLWHLDPIWFPYPKGWCMNCFNFPAALTNCSKWSWRVLQSSVVCPRSWQYWQWRFWLRLVSFQGSNVRLLEYWANHLSVRACRLIGEVSLGSVMPIPLRPRIYSFEREILAFPFPCSWSSLTCLCSSI